MDLLVLELVMRSLIPRYDNIVPLLLTCKAVQNLIPVVYDIRPGCPKYGGVLVGGLKHGVFSEEDINTVVRYIYGTIYAMISIDMSSAFVSTVINGNVFDGDVDEDQKQIGVGELFLVKYNDTKSYYVYKLKQKLCKCSDFERIMRAYPEFEPVRAWFVED